MDIKTYLEKHYKASTARAYYREIEHFLAEMPNAKQADYPQILAYINQLRNKQKPASLVRILQSIKKYYNYLIYIEIREDNPALEIQIKDYYSHAYFDGKSLLTGEELDQLWQHFLERKNRYKLLKNRNISMVGMLIHQAMTSSEIQKLKLQEIDLEKGMLSVPSSRLNARQLPLVNSQILPLYQYIHHDRPKLLKQANNYLFINKLGNIDKGETLHYLLQTARPYFKPHQFNPKTIRMSTITRKFAEGFSLLQAQYFAGHRSPTSTERYKRNDLQALKQAVEKYHPFA